MRHTRQISRIIGRRKPTTICETALVDANYAPGRKWCPAWRDSGNRIEIGIGAELWRTYSREEIAPLFGLIFSPANWNAGFVTSDLHVFLLVTLEKGDLFDEHQYEEKFLSPSRFQWVSQNRTTQASKHGQMIRYHEKNGISVHLFVRRAKKIQSKPAPFYYCGNVIYDKWEGERPIPIDWKLPISVPQKLQSYLLVPPDTH